jgi:hypothetical protein
MSPSFAVVYELELFDVDVPVAVVNLRLDDLYIFANRSQISLNHGRCAGSWCQQSLMSSQRSSPRPVGLLGLSPPGWSVVLLGLR